MKKEALNIIEKLIDNGFEAYFIGGSVRNTLHNEYHNDNLPIKDFDIVTNASYEDVEKLFSDVDARGEQFKVAVVKIGDLEFEVAQYRGESYPEGGSLRPNEVHTVKTLKEDVMRRDFTINGIVEDEEGAIIDYFGGFKDIEYRIIRAIGDPNQRFAEDPLRMLRAFRFMSQLGYTIEQNTLKGIVDNLHRLSIIPHERVGAEMEKILFGKFADGALSLMKTLDISKYTFYNSLIKQQVPFMKEFFGQNHFNFVVSLKRLKKVQSHKNIAYVYAALYSELDDESASNDISLSSFLNGYDATSVLIVLSHRYILLEQTPENLLDFVKELRGPYKNREELLKLIQMQCVVYDVVYGPNDFMGRTLFTTDLSFDGNDVWEIGKEFTNKQGPWIGEVMEKARDNSFLKIDYDLKELIKEVIAKK